VLAVCSEKSVPLMDIFLPGALLHESESIGSKSQLINCGLYWDHLLFEKLHSFEVRLMQFVEWFCTRIN